MAGRRVYGGSEMGVFYQNEGFSSDAFEVLLSSAPAPSLSLSGFPGSRSMLNFEDVCGVGSSMNRQSFYRTTHEIDEFYDDDFDECLHQPEKKRRLTTDQVKFLEKSFEVENKVEPERKVQLAKDLGLQPRQVAIWFQNRRARWKTKQLEKDYDGLKSSYDALKSDYDKLVEEKEKLKTQVVRLTEELIVKDKHKDTTEAIFDELKETQYNPTIHITETESQEVVGLKQEDHSSTGSTIIDSDSPRCTDGARTDCCIAFEPDQSDISHAEEDEEIKGYHDFLKLQDGSANFDFLDEDHTFLFWS